LHETILLWLPKKQDFGGEAKRLLKLNDNLIFFLDIKMSRQDGLKPC